MMAFFKKTLHTFTEGADQKPVIWYESDYVAVREGLGHTGSPEVESHFDAVKMTIEAPDQVRKDKNYPNRLCYYAIFPDDPYYPNHWMKVVLEQNRRGKLRVVTAYFTTEFKVGEEQIWKKL